MHSTKHTFIDVMLHNSNATHLGYPMSIQNLKSISHKCSKVQKPLRASEDLPVLLGSLVIRMESGFNCNCDTCSGNLNMAKCAFPCTLMHWVVRFNHMLAPLIGQWEPSYSVDITTVAWLLICGTLGRFLLQQRLL